MNGPVPVAFFANYIRNEADGDTLGTLDRGGQRPTSSWARS
jgi:hypothetical protein